jgi:hypothetical protein
MIIPALYRGLFDDAALFPPGNAAMPEAVTGHAGYQRQWYAELVGRFVCPAARLAELDGALTAAAVPPPRLSVTVAGGPSQVPKALADDQRIEAVELPVAAGELPSALPELAGIAERGVTVYAEIAVAEVSHDLAAALHRAGLRLKLRTGGASAGAFPDPSTLATAIEAAVAAGVRFKCTAGLHNAVAHEDPATGWSHHGFLNLLLAVHAAQRGSGSAAQLLADRNGAALAGRARELLPDEVASVRAQFASIGSCSVEEPLTDLTGLELVSAP